MPPMAFTPRRNAGFTLIELMTVIFVMAILMGIAVPSFQNTIRDNATAAASGELVSAIALAKSEAIKRSRPVTMCPRTTGGAACGTDWANGWMIFSEDPSIAPGAAPTVVAANIVSESAELRRNQIVQNNATNAWLRVTARGLLENTVSFSVLPKTGNCAAQTLKKNIAVGLAGKVSLTSERIGSC